MNFGPAPLQSRLPSCTIFFNTVWWTLFVATSCHIGFLHDIIIVPWHAMSRTGAACHNVIAQRLRIVLELITKVTWKMFTSRSGKQFSTTAHPRLKCKCVNAQCKINHFACRCHGDNTICLLMTCHFNCIIIIYPNDHSFFTCHNGPKSFPSIP